MRNKDDVATEVQMNLIGALALAGILFQLGGSETGKMIAEFICFIIGLRFGLPGVVMLFRVMLGKKFVEE